MTEKTSGWWKLNETEEVQLFGDSVYFKITKPAVGFPKAINVSRLFNNLHSLKWQIYFIESTNKSAKTSSMTLKCLLNTIFAPFILAKLLLIPGNCSISISTSLELILFPPHPIKWAEWSGIFEWNEVSFTYTSHEFMNFLCNKLSFVQHVNSVFRFLEFMSIRGKSSAVILIQQNLWTAKINWRVICLNLNENFRELFAQFMLPAVAIHIVPLLPLDISFAYIRMRGKTSLLLCPCRKNSQASSKQKRKCVYSFSFTFPRL